MEDISEYEILYEYMLCDTETEDVGWEHPRNMSKHEAKIINDELRLIGSPCRWIRSIFLDEDNFMGDE